MQAAAAAVAISGPLTVDDPHCAAAHGRRILAIHGADDQNVPIAGGLGSKGVSRVDFKSEESSRRSFESAGATYRLQVVPDADHFLNYLEAVLRKSEGVTIAQKAAAFFGIAAPGR